MICRVDMQWSVKFDFKNQTTQIAEENKHVFTVLT